jgi:tryptophan-rich sensory protein
VDAKSPMSRVFYYILVHFGVVLFVCKLICLMFVIQWSGVGELVLVMKWVFSYIVDFIYGNVNHNSSWWLVLVFLWIVRMMAKGGCKMEVPRKRNGER